MLQEDLADFLALARQGEVYHYNRSLVGGCFEDLDQHFKNAVVLDAGAGRRRKHLASQLDEARLLVGVDIAEDDLLANNAVDERVVGDLQKLPFEAESFDCIVSVDVVEHLSRPGDFFREASRTLRPGGVLIVCTPNLLGYKNLVARALPRGFLDLFWRVLKGAAGQPHRTYYRGNTSWQIRRIAASAGLSVEHLSHVNEISHFTYPYPLLATLIYAHGRLLEALRLGVLLPYLVCVLRKTVEAESLAQGGANVNWIS